MTKLSKKPTNIVFLLPILRILDKTPNLSEDQIQENIFENYEYTIDDIREDDNQIKRAILYLKQANFISEDNGKYQITKEGSELVKDTEKNEEEKDGIIIDILKKEKYHLPIKATLYSKCLTYLRDNQNHPIKRKYTVYDIIEKTTKYSENKDIMELRSPKERTFSGNCLLYHRFNYAISDLNKLNLIENSKDKGYQLTQEGLKILEDEDNINHNVSELLKQNTKKESSENLKLTNNLEKYNESKIISTDEIYEKLFLKVLSDKKEHKKSSIFTAIKEVLIPGIEIPVNIEKAVDGNIEKSRLKLEKENIIIQGSKKEYWKLTDVGIKLLDEENDQVETPIVIKKDNSINPIDTFEKSYHDIKDSFDEQLLDKVMESFSSTFFEKFVVDLLLKEDEIDGLKPKEGKPTPATRDGGIDGKIYFDGLKFPMCIQVKQFDRKINVQRPAIQSFIGALKDYEQRTGERTFKGMFVTTSDFSKGAKETAKSNNILLKNGNDVVKLMKKHEIGFKTKRYEVDLIDDEYFEDKCKTVDE